MKDISPAIKVSGLSKYYRVFHKQSGLLGSTKSLFARKYKTVKVVNNINFEIKEGKLSGEISVLNFIPWQRKKEFFKQIFFVMGKNQLWWDLPTIETFNLNKEIYYEISEKQYKETLKEPVSLLEVKDVLQIQARRLF